MKMKNIAREINLDLCKHIKKRIEGCINEMCSLINKNDSMEIRKYKLMKYGLNIKHNEIDKRNTYVNLMLNLTLLGVIDEYMPSGYIQFSNDFATNGLIFEKYIINMLKETGYNVIDHKGDKRYKYVDCVLDYNNMSIIVEIKSGNTDTTEQIKKYMEQSNADGFITFNGHDNNVNMNTTIINAYIVNYTNDYEYMKNYIEQKAV